MDNFADLAELEKHSRAKEINELIGDVENLEEIIETNEEYLEDEYEDIDDDLDFLLDKDNDAEEDL